MQARRDIRESARWYDERDPEVCDRFINTVGAAFDMISEAPQRWPLVRGLSPGRVMHYYVMSGFPYTIVYQLRAEDTVEILAVAHQKRRAAAGDPVDDTFHIPAAATGTHGSWTISGAARFYEGLSLPDTFDVGNVHQAGILFSSSTDPHLPLTNASPQVVHSYTNFW